MVSIRWYLCTWTMNMARIRQHIFQHQATIEYLPIEPGCFDVHVKVMSDPIENHGEGWAVLLPVALVVSNEVRVPMPGLPQLLLDSEVCMNQS